MALKPLQRIIKRAATVTSTGATVDLKFEKKLKKRKSEQVAVEEFILSRRKFNELNLENRGAMLFIDDESKTIYFGTLDPGNAVIFRGKEGLKKSLIFNYNEAVEALQAFGVFPEELPVGFKQTFSLELTQESIEGVYAIYKLVPDSDETAGIPVDEIPTAQETSVVVDEASNAIPTVAEDEEDY